MGAITMTVNRIGLLDKGNGASLAIARERKGEQGMGSEWAKKGYEMLVMKDRMRRVSSSVFSK